MFPLRCYLLLYIGLMSSSSSGGFINVSVSRRSCSLQSRSVHAAANYNDWIPLVGAENKDSQPPVRKLLIEDGCGDIAQSGSTIEIQYTGTLVGEHEWTTQDVISCWLSELQGLNHLSDIFREKCIDGSMLMDETKFTEEYCLNELGISNKIQAKKLVMAAKRIAKQQLEHQAGTEFDSSITRGKNFSFVLGGGKVIKAMDLIVNTMKVGERAKLICRSDYAYGSEGLRSSKGDVLVPPFATLCFDLKLIKADQ